MCCIIIDVNNIPHFLKIAAIFQAKHINFHCSQVVDMYKLFYKKSDPEMLLEMTIWLYRCLPSHL